MTLEEIKSTIAEGLSLFAFEYKDIIGGVDPWYNVETKQNEYSLFYDEKEITVYNLDDVFSIPFINGETLDAVYEDIIITAY